MEIHAHGFLLLGVFFWRGLSRILRGILRLSISGSQPLAIDLRHWPQTWRRAKQTRTHESCQTTTMLCSPGSTGGKASDNSSLLEWHYSALAACVATPLSPLLLSRSLRY